MSIPALVIRLSIPVAAASKPWGSHATSGRFGRPCPDWHRQHRNVLLLHSLPAQEQQLLQRRSRCHLPSQISPGRIRRSRSPGRCRMHPVSRRRDRSHRAFPVVTASTSWGQAARARRSRVLAAPTVNQPQQPLPPQPQPYPNFTEQLPPGFTRLPDPSPPPASANPGRSSMAVAVETPWRLRDWAAATNRLACCPRSASAAPALPVMRTGPWPARATRRK